jgi:hypothetical protein
MKLARMNPWGRRAMAHWKTHRPEQFAALADPVGYFTRLGEDAEARYREIRDGMLEGLNPNDGTIDWLSFQERTAQADQRAREIVGTEMIYLPPD